MGQNWVVIVKREDFKAIGARYGIDQVTARVMYNRGIKGDQAIREYLSGGLEALHNPHLMKDIDHAVDILQEKLRTQKRIRIIGDYDIDGVMSAYILYDALTNSGFDVTVRIPHRIIDGYGLNRRLIEEAHEDGVDTILTCDNGIAALEEIALAKSYGMTVIVTDHHEVPYQQEENGGRSYQRSEADAIVNPHQPDCNYPYKDLCGAGVAWKLIQILYERLGYHRERAYEYLENVAFATVGDIMPLTGENRILVKEGIRRVRRTCNIGMQALIRQCGVAQEEVGVYHFGFVLGPCINASGRLDSAQEALALFCETSIQQAAERAQILASCNEERKQLTEQGVQEAVFQYEKQMREEDPVIVLYLPELHESVAGIVAGRVRERYYKPTFILTDGQDGVKGSGRSVEEYSMFEQMSQCRELFERYGGHPLAAGLSLPRENVDIFRKRINELCPEECRNLVEKVRIDVAMPVGYVTIPLIEELERLGPYGKDNPRPLFAEKDVSIELIREIGKNKKGFKFILRSTNGKTVEAIYFKDAEGMRKFLVGRFGEKQLQRAMSGRPNEMRLTIAYHPRINEYRNERKVQISIENYK